MLRIFSAVTVCTILATQMPSKALSSTATLGERLFQFFEALGKDDVLYTTKASYQQINSRVDCVMRTKISSNTRQVRMCMRSEIHSPRLKPFLVKITYKRTKKCDVVTEGWSNGQYTLTVHYVGEKCVVYSVNDYEPLTPGMRACGIWRTNIDFNVPEYDECEGNATQVCGSHWRPISSGNKCARVPTPECKDYQDA
uniref:Putative secreted protein n=1 Tax=Ixodes ricinus TaxID=34613 RepID=A0A6B0V258_IXORI